MMPPTTPPDAQHRHITDLVLSGRLTPEAVDDVLEAGLAGLAIERLRGAAGDAASHAALLGDSRLRRASLLAGVRHATLRRVVADVVAAWRAAGIEVMLLKGFYLAEFVYPDPSWRQYSDVDVALRAAPGMRDAELSALAAGVASRHGWRVVWRLGEAAAVDSYHDPDYNGHELLLLRHEATGIDLDAHRRLVHSNVPARRRADKGEAITRAVWAASSGTELAGTPVTVPAPVDSALVGLVAARSWSGDRYGLRPHDLLDLEQLMRRGRFGREELLARARELGMLATARLFLKRCDPVRGVFDLRRPNPLAVFWYDWLLLPERGHRGLEKLLVASARLPSRLVETVRELPHSLRHLRTWREGGVLALGSSARAAPVDAAQASAAPPRPLDRRAWRLRQLAVRRSLQLLGAHPEAHRPLAVHCLHDSLLRSRHEVVHRAADGRVWLEYQGAPLAFDLLGANDGAGAQGAPGWPLGAEAAPVNANRVPRGPGPLVGRIAGIGWRGIRLRLEALFHLRRAVRGLRERPFRSVRDEMLAGRERGIESRRVAAAGQRRSACGRARAVAPREIGRAVESAARFVPGALCVAQSLSAQAMLTRRGVGSVIHFGFLRSESGGVEGHAWLEAAGEVVTGDVGLDDFTRTATFEA